MTPEELREIRESVQRERSCIYGKDDIAALLDHIDAQAARIAALERVVAIIAGKMKELGVALRGASSPTSADGKEAGDG